MWKKIVSILCLVTTIIMSLCAMHEIIPYYQAYKNRNELNKKVISQYTKIQLPVTNTDVTEDVVKTNIDFEELQRINPDIIGWISAPQINVDYPILRGETDEEYLNKDYNGNYTYLGSIFTWTDTDKLMNNDHIVIFGHNCIGRQMFGGLKDFRDADFMANNPYIDIYTPTQHKLLEVYNAEVVHCTDERLQPTYKNNSLEQSITLAACYGPQGTEYRMLVACKVIETEELF